MRRHSRWFVLLSLLCLAATSVHAQELELTLLRRVEGPVDATVPDRRTVKWEPENTAAIVCDMWDDHWCEPAARRTAELAVRINEVVKALRRKGVLIIHAPSGTMEYYEDYPARLRAQNAPEAENLPDGIDRGGRLLKTEEKSEWPVDVEHGCDGEGSPHAAWSKQIETIQIKEEDAITDRASEMWNLMEARGIENVLFMGVHTNMCVVNRPFGLRNLVRYGKNAVLVRDLTDAMYARRRPPHVGHFRGTELLVEYIEEHICPTVLSSDIADKPPFRFQNDTRKTVLLAIAEREYHTWETLPAWADTLAKEHDFRITEVYGWPKDDRNFIPAFGEHVRRADLVVLSVRRRALPEADLDAFRSYLEAGRPLVSLRTASHAFDVRGNRPEGHAEWPEFDREVLGCNYTGHHGHGDPVRVTAVESHADHAALSGVRTSFESHGSLYKSSPLAKGVTPLLSGKFQDKPPEPVAWVNRYGGARVFYTSLGHPDDFKGKGAPVAKMLTNAVFWALGQKPPER